MRSSRSWFAITAVTLVLSLTVPVGAQLDGPVRLGFFDLPSPPVRVISATADPDRFGETLRLRVRNTSQRPISSIALFVSFPECVLQYGPIGLDMGYGSEDVGLGSQGVVGASALEPGQEALLSFSVENGQGLDDVLHEKFAGRQVFGCVQVLSVSFGDNTGWELGRGVGESDTQGSGSTTGDKASLQCTRPAGESDMTKVFIEWTR